VADRTISEALFEKFCSTYAVPCHRIPEGRCESPDYEILLGDVRVVCEVKQIDPNADDLAQLREARAVGAAARWVPNRLRSKLKRNASRQLKAASRDGRPTLLVVYDNTPFKMYSAHFDVLQALFGAYLVTVTVPNDNPDAEPIVSEPFFGGNKGLTQRQNTVISAVAILDGPPSSAGTLRVYHNPYATVVLPPEILQPFPVRHCVLPGADGAS